MIALETKFAHQEHFVYELNKIVAEQQERIAVLEREVLEQRKLLEVLGGGGEALSYANSKPPHY